MRSVLAGDLGGTKCRFALITEDFAVHGAQRIDTVRVREPFLDNMRAAITETLRQGQEAGLEPPAAVGIGAAGVVGVDGESLGAPPNLPIAGFGLRSWIQGLTEAPVTLINDGRASAWGEYLKGHASRRDPLLCIFFGTGIGVGLIADGKPYSGANNAAGEIGHTVFRPGGRTCPCGAAGHFEAYCGGRAITERAQEALGAPESGSWDVGKVAAAADAGDTRAAEILDEAALAASTMVCNAATLLNPSAIVLGGGVLSGWPGLRDRIITSVRQGTEPNIHADLEFAPSLWGSDAILWGAAAATGALWRT